MASRRVSALRLLLAAATLLAARVEASPALRVVGGSGGAALVPGETAEVLFDVALLSGIDESELVLSLDGGARFPLRITRSQWTSRGSVSFRVPALPAARAVLALRGGAEDGERLLAESDAISIAADRSLPLEPIRRSDSEWSTREASDGPAEPPGGFESPAPTLAPLGGPDDPAAPPPSVALLEPSTEARRAPASIAAPPARTAAPAASPLSVSLPKRE